MDSYFILFFLFAIGTANAAFISVDSNTKSGNRIVGGSDAEIEQFPYQVSVITDNSWVCGGSIIDKNHVLTAGHCMEGIYNATVRAGSSHLLLGGSVHEVIKYKGHEKFHNILGDQKMYDIAILKVSPSFNFDATRSPIELSYDTKDVSSIEGKMITITGFGKTIEGGEHSMTLRVTNVSISNSKACNEAYGTLGVNPIPKHSFCAGDKKHSKDACDGDSGGPAVMNGRQIGIMSSGHICGSPDFPGIYTNVAYFAEWIAENISM